MRDLTIGALARASGVKIPTIRYYESIGLLPEAPRSEGGRRIYRDGDLSRLRFIRHGRELGFDVAALRELLRLAERPDDPCGDADAIARNHLAAIERRLQRLSALRDEVRRMVEGCADGRIAECRVIEALADAEHEHPPPDGAVTRSG